MKNHNKEMLVEITRFNCSTYNNITHPDELYCEHLFDGWSCWPDTPAGQTVNISCPDFVDGFNVNNFAFHKCEDSGVWFQHPEYNVTWANYTLCADLENFEFNRFANKIYMVGYSISLLAVVVSLATLHYFTSIHCTRIKIHMNLFRSFAANNLFWILWYAIVVGNTDILLSNPLWCRVLHVVLYYFLLTNYSWMLCEGIYIHTILVSAFVSEKILLRYMQILGWGASILIIAVYATVRQTTGVTSQETEQCWIAESKFYKILTIPVAFAIIVNAIFLVNIIRVLLIKIRTGVTHSCGFSKSTMQAFRATMLMAPLLGINFLIIPFKPESDHPFYKPYEILSAVLTSLQGLCLSILFCFCNNEVMGQIKRKYTALTFRPGSDAYVVSNTVSLNQTSLLQ